jgi:hypothetical protein
MRFVYGLVADWQGNLFLDLAALLLNDFALVKPVRLPLVCHRQSV